MLLPITLITLVVNVVQSLDNGLALTPPMGWMHWQRYRCVTDCDLYPNDCISEKLFRETADALVEGGYRDAGYKYVVIDDCWMAKTRDDDNRLQPNATRFPSGIKALADYVHSKGLKLGIYADFGTLTCAGYPGSIDNLKLDAQTFAEWEVDYLKLDGCYSNLTDMENGYASMSSYLNKTGRPIVFSCSWPAYMEPKGIEPNYTFATKHCNLWRNYDDINDSWNSVKNITEWFSKNQERLAPVAGPGHWNDPDMLLLGNFGLSYEQSKAQMSIWAILAAPLLLSTDVNQVDPDIKRLILNKDVIDINQDSLGIQGRLVLSKDKIDVWTRPILNNKAEQAFTYAVAFISNRIDGYPFRFTLKLYDIGLGHEGGYQIKDIYDPQSFKVSAHDEIFVRVKPTGAVLLRVTPLYNNSLILV